jgi:hypothetical protein
MEYKSKRFKKEFLDGKIYIDMEHKQLFDIAQEAFIEVEPDLKPKKIKEDRKMIAWLKANSK